MQISSKESMATLREEDLYLEAIKDLAASHREAKKLLKNELDKYRLNKNLSEYISELVLSFMPNYINAIKSAHFYKRLAIEFNLKKKFIEFLESLDFPLREEASLFFTKEIQRHLEEQCKGEHYSIEDYLLKSIRPRLNSRVSQLDPSLEKDLVEKSIEPFTEEIKRHFRYSIELKETVEPDYTLSKAIAYIDIRMHAAFILLVKDQSYSFQLLAYDFFYRKQLENNYKSFSVLALEYASNPYKLAKFISLSPCLFRRK